MKKAVSVFLSILMLLSVLSPASYAVQAASYADNLKAKGFPDSYVDALVSLHAKYPKWEFEPMKTNLDWDDIAKGERAVMHSQQVIQKSSSLNSNYYCDCASCKKNGSYVIQLSPNWVCASKAAIYYYMDPRNWLDVKHIFQFESTSYNAKQTQSGVENILSSTWMHNAEITYLNTFGNTKTYKKDGKTLKYSAAIMQAAKDSNMSAYYLASKIVLEVGSSTSSYAGGSCGTREPFPGIYNYFNIGAYTNATNGLEWANGFLRTSKATVLYADYDKKTDAGTGTQKSVSADHYCAFMGTYGSYYKVKLYTEKSNKYSAGSVGYILKSDIRTKYLTYGRPWTNPYRTIYHGAQYIADGYGKYQYTGYLQKFNVNPDSPSLYSHEYTTTVNAPSAQSVMTYNAYNKADVLGDARVFYIPVYKNMPAKKYTVPTPSDETTTAAPSANAVKGLKHTARTQESITLAWDKFSGAQKYYIYITNKTKGTHFDKTVTSNSATLKGLTPANEYTFKVRAYNGKKWSDYSAVLTRHTLPPKATGLKVTKVSATSATVSVDKVIGADWYRVYQYNSKKKTYTYLASISSNAGKVKLKGGTQYKLAVAACINDSETIVGAKSATVSVRTKTAKVKLKSVTSPKHTKIKAAWERPSGGVSGYQLVWAKDSAFKKKVAQKDFTSPKTVSYTGKNFTKGHTYYVRVRAYKTWDGKKKYGAWSTAKKVVCK